ncbi:hypothetical protein LshimejAT787_0904480 [Lyophyllum shimeji]|uniref:Uncharacterized protein n=1 Tax=Lyophyllum shimeji TaxID=47721 RepID=A0A9P3PSH3_LYOSH|nr:hypothetical protein LshimejAT787_0904480 [Lyophyllum shimeji]
MPSFRTVFAVAVTAFAALTSAAPAVPGTNNLNGLSGKLSGINSITSGGPLHPVGHVPRDDVEVVDLDIDILNADKRDGQLHSLPEILVDCQSKLSAVSDKLTAAIGVKAIIEVEVVLPIIAEVKVIVFNALGCVQAIVNHPREFVLGLAGKVLSIPEVAKLLVTVLALLCTILTTALRVVGAASAHLVAPAIHGVGAVVYELLSCIFALVAGLLPRLHQRRCYPQALSFAAPGKT